MTMTTTTMTIKLQIISGQAMPWCALLGGAAGDGRDIGRQFVNTGRCHFSAGADRSVWLHYPVKEGIYELSCHDAATGKEARRVVKVDANGQRELEYDRALASFKQLGASLRAVEKQTAAINVHGKHLGIEIDKLATDLESAGDPRPRSRITDSMHGAALKRLRRVAKARLAKLLAAD